jgi:hypothetical protein
MSGWKCLECLSTHRACAPRGLDSRPHVNREGEKVGIGVSLVRLFSCISGHMLASTLTFAPLRRDLSIHDCIKSLKVESFKIWRLNNMLVLLTQSHQAFCQVLGHGGDGHYRHWDVEPKTVVPHIASSKVRCGGTVTYPAISDTAGLMTSCTLMASFFSTMLCSVHKKSHQTRWRCRRVPCDTYKMIPRWQQSLVVALTA